MKKFFTRLSSMERRFVVGVLVAVFLMLNAMFVWPRFSDWSKMQFRMAKARKTASAFETEITEKPKYEKQVKTMESEALPVPLEDQSVEFSLTIQSQAAKRGVNIISTSPQPVRTNLFFIEQARSLSVQSGEQQLVDFLYDLGSGTSLTRVRDLSLRPDPPRQNLSANIKLVASYQKKPAARPATPAATAATPAAKPSKPTDKKP